MPQGSEPDRGEKESDGKLIHVFFVCLWLTFGENLSYFSQYKALMVLYNSIYIKVFSISLMRKLQI